MHLPDFFICLARRGVRCGSYVRGEEAGWDGTAPAAGPDVFFSEVQTASPPPRGCSEKVVSIVVAAAVAKDGELLAAPSGDRYKQADLAVERGESLKGQRINQALKLQASPCWFP